VQEGKEGVQVAVLALEGRKLTDRHARQPLRSKGERGADRRGSSPFGMVAVNGGRGQVEQEGRGTERQCRRGS